MNQKLFKAVESGDKEQVENILKDKRNSELNILLNDKKQSPLHIATFNNDISLTAYLLSRGFDPNQQDENKLSPFIAAAANGFDDIFNLMILYKGNKDQVNRFGGTALLPSSEKGYLNSVQQALDYGVPVNHQNRLGWTALLEAVILGDGGYLYKDIIRELLVHKANPNIRDFENKTALQYALDKKQETVSMMFENVKEDEYTIIRALIRNNKLMEALYETNMQKDDTQKYYYIAYIYERLKDYNSAEFYYQKGLKKDSQFAFYLAQIYRKTGEVEKSLKMFDYDLDSEFLQYHKSNYLRELNRHNDAIEIMDNLLLKDPNRTDYMFHKANSLRSLKKHQEAYDLMVKAESIVPTNDLFEEHYNQSLLLMKGE